MVKIGHYNQALRHRILGTYYRCHDFQTKRKIVVFESDDWGSIRMSSRQSWEALLAEGYHVNERPYERFDTLECDDDIMALADVLSCFKDNKGNHPIITLNYLSANPDFQSISTNGLETYSYESVASTYNKYPTRFHNVIELVRKGMIEGVFMPQCHGREHFNVQAWMNALKSGDEDTLVAFRYNMCGIAPKNYPEKGNHFMVALESQSDKEQEFVCNAIDDALKQFEELWGFPSQTFVAPCYTWNKKIEQVLHKHNVRLIQTSRIQHLSHKKADVWHYSGQRNSYGQIYSLRNCSFEPATSCSPQEEAGICMKQIEKAFNSHKPAIISSHRINFVSGIDENNRRDNLIYLHFLLASILRFYPDVEFLSSNQLISLYNNQL